MRYYLTYLAKRTACLSALCVLFGSIAAWASDKPRVTWRVTDWPPFYIMDGPQCGKGLYDVMIHTYQKALPQFEHTNVEMTTMRALQQMKNRQEGTVICHVSMLLNSLTGFALNSDLTSILPAHVIIAHKDVADEILLLSEHHDGFVSVEQLLLNTHFKGAYSSFGTHAALEKYQYIEDPLPNVTLTSENYVSLGRLFLNKRVDYIVQYEPFVETLVSQGMRRDDIAIIKIAETRDKPFVSVYAGCTLNALGRTVIATINTVNAQKLKEIQAARIQWFSPEGREALKAQYERIAPELNDYVVNLDQPQ